jgi:hypothetical protein
MTLLEQLEQELAGVQDQLRQLTRERTILREQITRLRMGAPPGMVRAALRVAVGVRPELHLLGDDDTDLPAPSAERVAGAALDDHRRLRTPKTAA